MTFHPGGLVGLPVGVPDPRYDLGLWRDLLVGVALLAAWLVARGRRALAVLAALAFAELALAFWVASLARPYGVLVDTVTTRWAAGVSVVAASGVPGGFLAGEPGVGVPWVWLAAALGPGVVYLPTLLPLVALAIVTLSIAGLARPREAAALAAVLWAAGATGAWDALRGVGLWSEAWGHPLGLAGLTIAVPVVLALARLGKREVAVTAGALVALIVAAIVRGPAFSPGDAVLLLTLDQWPWLALGAFGLARERNPAALAAAAGGALAVAASVAGLADPWTGHAFYRLGLILASADALGAAGAWVEARVERPAVFARRGWETGAVAKGLVVAIVLAGSFLAWWDPTRSDPIARASVEPVSPAVSEAMEWVRTRTPRDATFVAPAEYVAAVAVLGGRRVLRAPDLAVAPDDERRRRLERALLAGRVPEPLRRRYGVAYVLVAPGSFPEHGLERPEDLEGRAGLRTAWAGSSGIRIYALSPSPGGAAGPSE